MRHPLQRQVADEVGQPRNEGLVDFQIERRLRELLAIAYEHEGKFEDAKKAYEKALSLEPKNIMIRQNYDLFKEINDRTKRRAGK